MARAVLAMGSSEKKLADAHENGPSSHDSEQELHREKEGSKGISPRVKTELGMERGRRTSVSD
jgi:hypothetical protein